MCFVSVAPRLSASLKAVKNSTWRQTPIPKENFEFNYFVQKAEEELRQT
jgi:hypothetical protein